MTTNLAIDLIRELTRLHGAAVLHHQPVEVCVCGDSVNCFGVKATLEGGRIVLYPDITKNSGRRGLPYTPPPRAA